MTNWTTSTRTWLVIACGMLGTGMLGTGMLGTGMLGMGTLNAVRGDQPQGAQRVAVRSERDGAALEGKSSELWTASPLTKEGEFTKGIEGPATDSTGNVFVVNFGKEGTIGRTTPGGASELFATLPNNSIGNGIRFDRQGRMFIADYVNHNVLLIPAGTSEIQVHAHDDRMNQPNDLAITRDGVLFASDPNWGKGTGQLWRIGADGKVVRIATDLGTTNGIELSPDDQTLYVNESVQRNIWSFRVSASGEATEKTLLKHFPDHGFDGMRCDIDGNLYVTRYGKGTVVKLSPKGEVLKEIDVLGKSPSNLCFGGSDGCTVYVTEVEHTRIVQFRVDRPGREWQMWQDEPEKEPAEFSR